MARSFNGSSDIIDLGTLNVPSAVSISAWIYPPSSYAANNSILCMRSGSVYCLFQGQSGSNLLLEVNTTSGDVTCGAITTTGSVWQNACVVYDTTNGMIGYVNGIQKNATGPKGTISGGGVPWLIGNDPGNSRFWSGRMADVAVWNIALTANEVVALSQGARPWMIRPSNLIGWWPLDGLQSPEPDLSGNKQNGTLTGTAFAFGPPVMQFTPRWPQFLVPPVPPPPFTLMPQIVT